MAYSTFKVIGGSETALLNSELNFYSSFFFNNHDFPNEKVFKLTTPGNFVGDRENHRDGEKEVTGVIQGIDNGGYEFENLEFWIQGTIRNIVVELPLASGPEG